MISSGQRIYVPARTNMVQINRTFLPGLLKYVFDSLTVAGAVRIPMVHS